MSKRHFRLFLALLLISISLMAYQSYRGAIRPLHFLIHPMNSLNNSIYGLTSSSGRTSKTVTMKYEELQELKGEIDKLRLQTQRLGEIQLENERLRELLSLKDKEAGYFTSAKVIARGADQWSNTIVIDKGSKDFLKKDMAVVTPRGLAGKIQDVYESYSSVLLINDVRFRAAGRLQASRAEGIFSGRGTMPSTLDYVGGREAVKEGEVIVTSGLDGLFPPGLSIGYVSRASNRDRKFFIDIDVIPFVDTRKLEEVIILR